MRLVSLGGLRLEGEKFRREKPLLMLAFLALEGPKLRRYVAELFWPDKPNPLTNLAVALDHLRKLGAANGDGGLVWAEVECDALELREHLRAGRVQAARKLYQDAFVLTLDLEDIGPELEEWVLTTREGLGSELRTALLLQSEEAARASHFRQAGELAEAAYRLPGCPELEPEELPRYYRLLRAAEHPLAKAVEREAQELELVLDAPASVMRERLRPQFVGRESELSRLSHLEHGQWAWVRGAPGMGKTALLRELSRLQTWRYLPARSGLPYATLETLLGELDDAESVLLRRLTRHTEGLIFDDWDNMDAESQHLLKRLNGLRPAYPVVLAGTGEAPFGVEVSTELLPLTPGDLTDDPEVFQATGGVPVLVGAYLRGEPLESALSTRLERLSTRERQVYACLVLLPTPDLTLVRQALELGGAELVAAYEGLMTAGLVEASCEVRGPGVAQRYLDTEPGLAQHLSLKLARLLPVDTALPLYQRARPVWEDSDLRRVEQAFATWAEELLRRGFHRKAADLLADAPPSDLLSFVRARALERCNLFKPALDILHSLPATPEANALLSRVLFKLGDPQQAQEAAEATLKQPAPLEAEAEALNTLGELALRGGQAQQAANLFSRCATLWQATGQKSRWLWAMNNRAYARTLLGDKIELAFQEVLTVTQDDLSVRAAVLNNMGNGYAQEQNVQKAEEIYRQAVELGEQSGALTASAMAWNGIGVMFHASQPGKARTAYQAGLQIAQQIQDAQLTAILLANLAELDGDIPAWEQAIELLERSGFRAMAHEFREQLQSFIQR